MSGQAFYLKEVIEKIQNYTGKTINQSVLADDLDVSRQYISSLAKAELPLKFITRLEAHYGMELTKYSNNNSVDIDYYPEVYASCGNGAEPFSTRSEKMSVSKTLIKGYNANKRYHVINTTSDSMMPEIYPNDFLVIETEPESIKDNSIYVFTYENEIYCKYLCRNITEIIVRSANKAYRDIFIIGEDRQKIKVLGEVVAVMRDLTR